MCLSTRAVIRETGDPDVIDFVEERLDDPGALEVRVRHTAIGINFLDTMQRRGVVTVPLPSGLGHEAAGVVEAVGSGVSTFSPGDRVCYMNAGLGAYATHRNVPADKLVRLPDAVADADAAALLFKGLTAQYLLRRTFPVGPDHRILLHAAAGGVGLIMARWATALGAEVIGTASSDDKCEAARDAGCRAVFNYSRPDWASEIQAMFQDRKADVAYDSVGAATFMQTLDLVRPFGMMVVFGGASGPAPAIAPELLNAKGCLFLTRPSVFPHNATAALLQSNAKDLFEAVELGYVRADIGLTLRLSQARKAHRAMEAREVSGSIILVP